MDNGDILLFQSNYRGMFGWWARIIRFITRSKWTHVAMILKDPTFINPNFKGLYVIESGSEPWCKTWGTIVSPLHNVLSSPDHDLIAHRKLFWNIPNDELKVVYNTVVDKPYDTDPLELLGNELQSSLLANPKEANTFVCSTLVAYMYTALGLLPNNTKWFYFQPWHFSKQNRNLKLLHGYLGEEHIL